ncbi:MAG: indole-3-glycerol phosphate synthase TrpC [Chlamydiota bacterium]
MISNYLDAIVERKKKEVDAMRGPPRLKEVLRQERLTVIAEIKRRSPAKGDLAPIADPVLLASRYAAAGASAFSVLTDGQDFGGSLEDLRQIARAFPEIPILRKDFIVDVKQIRETVRAGASAVLLIAAVLGEKLPEMIAAAISCGLDPLVEVHNREELEIALVSGAEIIGVNNRNLATFQIDLAVAEALIAHIPSSLIRIAESGVRTAKDAQRMRQAGYDAILVGEALVTALDLNGLLEEFCACH